MASPPAGPLSLEYGGSTPMWLSFFLCAFPIVSGGNANWTKNVSGVEPPHARPALNPLQGDNVATEQYSDQALYVDKHQWNARSGSVLLAELWYKTSTLLRRAAGSSGMIRAIGRLAMLFGNSNLSNAPPHSMGFGSGGPPCALRTGFFSLVRVNDRIKLESTRRRTFRYRAPSGRSADKDGWFRTSCSEPQPCEILFW